MPQPLARTAASATRAAARLALENRTRTPSTPAFPVVPTCPEPTCACPPMPAGLDIDHGTRDLSGSMAAYGQHLVVATGQSDWTSRIEDERDTAGWGRFAADVKALTGPRGELHDFSNNVLVSTASFPVPSSGVEAYLFPRALRLRSPTPAPRPLAQRFLRPSSSMESADDDGPEASVTATPLTGPTILICSHGQRDSRCGVLGPLLHACFTEYLASPSNGGGGGGVGDGEGGGYDVTDARVGMISHVGGHKWAGNVIVYTPPTAQGHTLAGTGVWYGRVEPRHVPGIVEATVREGRVIRELFRGGVRAGGGLLRL